MFNTELEDKIGGFWDGYDKENLPLISQLMKEAGKFLFWKKKTKFKKKKLSKCIPIVCQALCSM